MTIPVSPQSSGTLTLGRVLRRTGGLDDTPASTTDRDALLAHLGRDALHGSKDRNFSAAYYRQGDDQLVPRMYRVGSKGLARCQYVMLTNPQYAAVLVIDVDQWGTEGGRPENLNSQIKTIIAQMVQRNIGPAWVGINPQSGKAQMLWLIDPVYAGPEGSGRHMGLLKAATRTLGQLLDHDPHFSHRFSRSPFYEGKDPTAYRWYCQHKRVVRLSELLKEFRDMAGLDQNEKLPRQQFSSGRELIEAVKARREEAEAFKALAKDVEGELGDLDAFDPDLVDGVRVLWIGPDHAARDETAFRHALKSAHRLRAKGERMTDAKIIDAYEHAYKVAQRVGSAGRLDEMPKMRDRQTMARRVRGYVLGAKSSYGSSGPSTQATTPERKALATMGHRGGLKAAQRWKDRNSDYAQTELSRLSAANRRRQINAESNQLAIASWFMAGKAETGEWPAIPEAMAHFGVSRDTVKRALQAAEIKLPRGRRTCQKLNGASRKQ